MSDDSERPPARRRAVSRSARTALLLRHVPGVYLVLMLGAWVAHAAVGFSTRTHLARLSQSMGERPATYLLMACLACTPMVRILGVKWAAKLRKPFGMYAFAYGSMSLFAFWAQHQFVVSRTVLSIAHQPFVIFGVAALLIYVPLALTSTTAAIRRLGGHRWRMLHRLTYVAGALVMVHLLLLPGDAHIQAPLPVTVFSILMLVRVPPIRRFLRARVEAASRRLPRSVNLAGAMATVGAALGVSVLASIAADPAGLARSLTPASHRSGSVQADTPASGTATNPPHTATIVSNAPKAAAVTPPRSTTTAALVARVAQTAPSPPPPPPPPPPPRTRPARGAERWPRPRHRPPWRPHVRV